MKQNNLIIEAFAGGGGASVGIKVLKGYAEMVKESLVFQMPEDSEVKG